MAKREQVVEETLGLIAQAQAEYGTIVEEVRSYCQKKARELRQSGNTDPQVATELSKLLGQADYYNHLADQKDVQARLEILRRIDCLEREASGLRETVHHNENVLARQQIELEEIEREAVLMVQRAKKQIQKTEQLLESQRAKLTELEGNRVEKEVDQRI